MRVVEQLRELAEHDTVMVVVLEPAELDLNIGEVLELWLERVTGQAALGYCSKRMNGNPCAFYLHMMPADEEGMWYGICGQGTLMLTMSKED